MEVGLAGMVEWEMRTGERLKAVGYSYHVLEQKINLCVFIEV